jgi:O-antigen/teichoic acid export membrane protein
MEKEPKYKKIIEASDGLSLGMSIVFAVLIGVGMGIGLKYLFGYSWLLWVGIFWGLAGAFLNVYKMYRKQKKELDELANEPRYKYTQEQLDKQNRIEDEEND